MLTIVGILKYINWTNGIVYWSEQKKLSQTFFVFWYEDVKNINFMLIWAENDKSFVTSGVWFHDNFLTYFWLLKLISKEQG